MINLKGSPDLLNPVSPITTARKLSQQYKTKTAPVDIIAICEDIGLKIRDVSMDEYEKTITFKITSILLNHPTYGWTILNNEENTTAQKRFALAHELGHYLLHMKSGAKHVIASFRGDHAIKEIQADKFAMELLLPEDLVRKEHSKYVIPICSSLAEAFGVPRSIMCKRLEKLNLIAI